MAAAAAFTVSTLLCTARISLPRCISSTRVAAGQGGSEMGSKLSEEEQSNGDSIRIREQSKINRANSNQSGIEFLTSSRDRRIGRISGPSSGGTPGIEPAVLASACCDQTAPRDPGMAAARVRAAGGGIGAGRRWETLG
jgi:hypothetical protein